MDASLPSSRLSRWKTGLAARPRASHQFDQLDPDASSEEGIINDKVMNEWGKILPKLIFAKTDAEFDQIWNDYQAKRESLGFAKVQEFRQKEYEENVKKRGIPEVRMIRSGG